MTEQEARAELDSDALYAAHVAVEDMLIELRDDRVSVLDRANGLIVKERDGTPNPIMRMGTREALQIGITAYLSAARLSSRVVEAAPSDDSEVPDLPNGHAPVDRLAPFVARRVRSSQRVQVEYTPTTEWIRIMVGYAKTTATDRELPIEEARAEGYEWFDRWLAGLERQIAAKALTDAAEHITGDYLKRALLARAGALGSGESD